MNAVGWEEELGDSPIGLCQFRPISNFPFVKISHEERKSPLGSVVVDFEFQVGTAVGVDEGGWSFDALDLVDDPNDRLRFEDIEFFTLCLVGWDT